MPGTPGAEIVIDLDLAAIVDLEAGGLQREPVGVGPAADGDQHDVRFDVLASPPLGRFDRYDDAIAPGAGPP
jgi:hypothetical protein